MSAQYSITHNVDKHHLKLKIFAADAEEPTSAKCSASADEIIFICAPYYLRIKPRIELKPGEYYPKFDDEKFVFEYKVTTVGAETGETVESNASAGDVLHPYGFDSSFTDSLELMRDDLKQICGIEDPDKLSPKERRHRRTMDEDAGFKLDYYQHDYWHVFTDEHMWVQMPEIDLDIEMSADDERKLTGLVKKPMVRSEIGDTKQIDLGLIDILFATACDWRQNNSEINEATSAWARLTLSATLSYFDAFETLDDVFRSFYRRALTYPLYRNKLVARSCIEDVYGALARYGQQWILKQLLTTYTLFNLNNYCILNRYYIVEYIKYVYRFVTDDDATQWSEMLKEFHVARYSEENFGWNLEKVDVKLMQDMFADEFAKDDSDDEATESSDEDDDDEPDLADQMQALKV